MAELGMVDDKSRKGDFQTDADISASKGPKERDLQRWVPDGPDPAIASSGSKRGGDSETFGTNSAGGWDQFETNKRLFGGDSTYDENIYTTKLDRSAPDFEVRKREAERLANEIQNVRSP
jgi:PAB1-binding protein PBP1